MHKKGFRLSAFLAGFVLFVGLLHFCFPTYKQREKEYYSERDNYITVTGIITDIEYYDSGQICIYVSEKSADFLDTGFILKGKNAITAMDNGIESKLYTGITVKFVCAPRYFGDGYKIPIVALNIEEDAILDFETGFNNLLAEYK